MAKERTEEQVLLKVLEVTLGGEKREIKLLPYRKSREWKQKVLGLINEMGQYTGLSADQLTSDKFTELMANTLIGNPDQMVGLFFDYAPDLDRNQIEETATEQEIAAAFERLVEVSFPLSGSLTKAIQNLAR